MGDKERKKGATLFSFVVAIFVLIIVASVATVILLHYIHRGKVGAVAKDIASIRNAVNSALVRGDLKDENSDGNYLDDLIQKRYLTKVPSILPGARYTVQSFTDNSSNITIYFLKIECLDDECQRVFRDLDKEIDQGDGPAAGSIQWIES